LPDDCSLEDIQYYLYVLGKVRQGIGRAGKEGTVTQAIVKEHFSNLLKGRSDYELADCD
jgi:hypothetical protein